MSPSLKQIILTSSPDGPIMAYDASSTTAVACFSGCRSPRRGLTFIGKSWFAASHMSLSTGSCSIHLYNWYSQSPSHNIPVPEPVAPLVASPDGSCIFGGGISGNIHVIGIPSGDMIRSIPAHEKPVSCLGMSEDGSVLISGFDDGKIVMIPIFQLVDDGLDKNDFTFRKFCAHDGSVTAIASCASKIISCSMDCTCKIWTLLNGTHLQTLEFPSEILAVAAAAADPTETRLYFGGLDGSIYNGSVNFAVKVKPIGQNCSNFVRLDSKHKSSVVSIVMANEAKTLVSAAEDGDLFMWDTETGIIKMGFGDNGIERSISDMLVLDGFGDTSYFSMNMSKTDGFNGVSNGEIDFGLSAKLLGKRMEDRLDLEDVLRVAKKDRSKAIDMLESAIAMYEKLLELILREARRGRSIQGDRGDDEKEMD